MANGKLSRPQCTPKKTPAIANKPRPETRDPSGDRSDRSRSAHNPQAPRRTPRPARPAPRGTRWPFKMTVARLPLGSEFSGIAAYGADFVLPTNFTILQSCLLSQGGSHGKARHFCCSDRRSRWRLLRCGGLGRRRHADEGPIGRGGFGAQGVHRRLELYCHGLPADLAGHHGLRRD